MVEEIYIYIYIYASGSDRDRERDTVRGKMRDGGMKLRRNADENEKACKGGV